MNDNLHLPPERDVPDPEAMFASIIGAADAPSPMEETGEFGAIDELALQRRKRRRLAPFAIAAAAAAVALGVGISYMVNGRTPSPAQSPSIMTPSDATTAPSLPVSNAPSSAAPSSSTPTTSASSSTAPSSSAPRTSTAPSASRTTGTTTPATPPAATRKDFGQYGKATFKYVTIERLPRPENYTAPMDMEFIQGWYMRICVTGLPADRVDEGTLPVGAAAFRSELVPNGQQLTRFADGHKPVYPPPNSTLALGQCATGFVSFSTAEFVNVDSTNEVLIYSNSFNEIATWRLN